MAMPAREVVKWLQAVIKDNPKAVVAVDDGGLTLVELDDKGEETGTYLELGGVPGSIFGDE